MGVTERGLEAIASRMMLDDVISAFDVNNAALGVGDSSAAFDNAQSNLLGTNTFRKTMDDGYPQRTDNQITFKATFDADEAVFMWREEGIFNDLTGGIMLTRESETAILNKTAGMIVKFTKILIFELG